MPLPEPESKKENPVSPPNINDIGQIISGSQPGSWDNKAFNYALKSLLERGQEINSSLIYDGGLFSTYFRVIRQYLPELPTRTLEVGPGRSIGASIMLAMRGVKEAHTMDPFPNLNFDIESFAATLRALAQTTSFLNQIAGGNGTQPGHDPKVRFQDAVGSFSVPDCSLVSDNEFKIGNNRVAHFPQRFFEETRLEGNTYNFIFSHAALEHVRDPQQCIRELGRLLKPGGVTAHQIDLRDHRDFSKPLDFLKESPETWQKIVQEMCKYDGALYMNRWRRSQWIKGFQEQGFEVLEAETNMKWDKSKVMEILPQLDKNYRHDVDDLESISMFLVAKRK